jgi:glycosyltransferase involved in cell wall biosynthesis
MNLPALLFGLQSPGFELKIDVYSKRMPQADMHQDNIFIIVPAFNEGSTINELIGEIGEVIRAIPESMTIVIVDDGSTDDTLSRVRSNALNFDGRVRVITLMYNLGHQAAIAQGILFAHTQGATHAIIMDGDGEDDPQAIPQLIGLKGNDIVHVIRGRRQEPAGFRLAYGVYRILFRLITRKKMNFGNFCLINARVMEILTVRSFIHFPAFLSKLPFKTVSITSDRRIRMGGRSKMSLTGLVHHAFRSFAEYSEALLMIFLRLFVFLFIFFILVIGYILYIKLFTDRAILGWTSTFGIGLLISALLCMGFFVSGLLLLNLTQSRNNIPPSCLYKVIV